MTERIVLGIAILGVVLASPVGAATGADYEMGVVPAATELPEAGGTANLSVQLTSKVDGTQGWSFGVVLTAAGGASASITAVRVSDDTQTVNDGGPAGFNTTSYYAAGDLANKVNDCKPECTGIDAAAVTQGVVIDMMMQVTLPASTGFNMVDLTVEASGPEGSEARVEFSDEIGTPPVETVAVYGGDSISPDVLQPAVITFKAGPTPTPFTIDIADAAGNTGDEVVSVVTLNFNADGTQEGVEIQGWSYGACVQDPAKAVPLSATVDGTDSAGAKDGAPPDFNNINIYPEGVTHGVVIDMMSQVTIPAQNDWSDLAVTYRIDMTVDDDFTYVTACNERLGTPPVANVMVVGGGSINASDYEGTDPATDCPEPNLCNTPGKITKLAKPPLPAFEPGNVNGDARVDIADGIYLLSYLFRSGPEPPCLAAADYNNDGIVDQSDAIAIIYWRLQPDVAGKPPEGWPEPALGLGCAEHETELSCEIQCTP